MRTLLNWLGLLGLVLVLSGCRTHGHRKMTIELFGSQFVLEDEVSLDEKGESEYIATFDDKNNIANWLFGWLAPDSGKSESTQSDTE